VTGHNHYPDCSCGWCVNHGRTRVNRTELRSSYRLHEAQNFLKQNGARSIAGCYVNPNARCPVCGAAVFFYANEFGSRVYFDDLGPPWPKHPCTDNPRRKIAAHPAFAGAPVRRARGISQELLEAARISESFRSPASGGGRWQLLVIVGVSRRGSKNTVQGQFLASDDDERTTFSCFSDEPLFEVDDFISNRGNAYSFLNKTTLETAIFTESGWVKPQAVEQQQPSVPVDTGASRILRPVVNAKVVAAPKPPARTYDITRAEMGHFHSKKTTVQQICDKLMPVVRAYARAGIRKPRQVSERLNMDGHRTVQGARWTPRLTYFLLGLIFMPNRESTGNAKAGNRDTVDGAPKVQESTEALTPEEMARRLSRLGRVVLSDERP
jgi:hypothetical protein